MAAGRERLDWLRGRLVAFLAVLLVLSGLQLTAPIEGNGHHPVLTGFDPVVTSLAPAKTAVVKSRTEERRPEPVVSTRPRTVQRPVPDLVWQITMPGLPSVRLATEAAHKEARAPPSLQMEQTL